MIIAHDKLRGAPLCNLDGELIAEWDALTAERDEIGYAALTALVAREACK